MHTPFVVAYLGPLGTYSHQAAYDRFEDAVDYHECRTIADVFEAVARKTAHAGVVPQENSIYGSVIETYDALRNPGVGFIRGEVVLEIQHSVLVPRGVSGEDIRVVRSHEQALGQCRGYIARHFPLASIEKVSSTAAAAKSLVGSLDTAAIASKLCATVFDGLEVLDVGVQDSNSNYTRFYILTLTQEIDLPLAVPASTRGMLRVFWGDSGASITRLFSVMALTVHRFDRRPRIGSTHLSQDVYFLELEGSHSELMAELERVRGLGATVDFLGSW